MNGTAFALTALLALVTPPPSPAPTASPSAPTTTLTFTDALRRLIPDAPYFVKDRGAIIVPDKYDTSYALNFVIDGLTDCSITPQNTVLNCVAYRGSDAAVARSTYSALKAELQSVVGADAHIEEETNNDNAIPSTLAVYTAKNNVKVGILIIHDLKGVWMVAVEVGE